MRIHTMIAATAIFGFILALTLPMMGEYQSKEAMKTEWASRVGNHKKIMEEIKLADKTASHNDKGLLLSTVILYEDVYKIVIKTEKAALFGLLDIVTRKCLRPCSAKQLSKRFRTVPVRVEMEIRQKWTGQKLREHIQVFYDFFPPEEGDEPAP